MKNSQIETAFFKIFPDQQGNETKVVQSKTMHGDDFYYIQSKEGRLKIFADRVEVWDKIHTKNPVKTLELELDTIKALNKLYEKDTVL